MPEYLTPGVYVEEFEIGARPIDGVSTSTTGFLGLTERGPKVPPKLVTSWDQFMLVYGAHIKGSYLASAVEGFFNNGGQRCFIGRITHPGALPAVLPKDTLTIKAAGEGSWGNRVGIRIEKSSSEPENPNKFTLIAAYWKKLPSFEIPADKPIERALNETLESASLVERFDNLSSDPDKPAEFYLKTLGDPMKNSSNLIILSGTGRPANTDGVLFEPLLGGLEEPSPLTVGEFQGESTAGKKTGLYAFEEIDEISIINAPDIYIGEVADPKPIIDAILTHCEKLKYRFAIIDTASALANFGEISINNVARSSKYGAIYFPWIKIYDPLTQRLQKQPPGGHIAGIYARSDNQRGVHKAPANEIVRGAMDLEYNLTKGEQSILNPRGINVIRYFKESGRLVWGARTSIIDPLWKYINVRRLFIYIEASIEKGTQWAVFEPNDQRLWARVKATITQFLTRVWKDGALMGTKPEEAFFVKCDRTTMTQDDIDNGRLICVIGIAPVKPAEFVIFRIAQWQGGSAATE